MMNPKTLIAMAAMLGIEDPQAFDYTPALSNPFEGSGRSGKKGNCTNRTPATTKKRKAKRQATNTSKRSNR